LIFSKRRLLYVFVNWELGFVSIKFTILKEVSFEGIENECWGSDIL
jgi:hypothetical protein